MDSSDPRYSSVRGDKSRDAFMEQGGMGVMDVLTGDRESGGSMEGGLVVSGHPKLRRIKQSSPVRLQSIAHPSSPPRKASGVADSANSEQNLCWEKLNPIAPLQTISLPGDSQMDSDVQVPPCPRATATQPAALHVDNNTGGVATNPCLLSPCDDNSIAGNDCTSSNKALRERSLDVGYCSDSENDHSDVSRNASGVSDCSSASVTVSDSESSVSSGGGLGSRSSGLAGYRKVGRLPDRAIEQISPTGVAYNSQEIIYDQTPAQTQEGSTCGTVAPSGRAGEARMFFASHHGSLGNPGEPASLSHQLAHSCSLSSSDIDPDLPYSPEGGCSLEQYPPSPLASTYPESSSELDFTCDDYLVTRDYAVRLGYSEKLVKQVCLKLGKVRPSQDQLLEELLKIGVEASKCSPSPDVPSPEDVGGNAGNPARCQGGNPNSGSRQEAAVDSGSSSLRAIVIDGSNVAMAFGNKQVFSCLGIKNCVEWFSARGHTDIKVFVPQFRREESRHDAPITDQHILDELECMGILVWTPSRRIGSRRIVCHDDRFILKTAVEKDAIIVSNDEFRDLAKESPEFRKVIEERLLMFTMVDGKFMPPDDPLARWGPTLDQFLRVGPPGGSGSGSAKLCPYGKKCTYGAKCKFSHPGGHHQSVTEQVLKRAQKERRRIVASTPSIDAYMASQKKLQSALNENGEKSKLCRAHSLTPALLNIPPGRAAMGHRTPSPNPPGTFGQVLCVNSASGLNNCDNNRKPFHASTAQQHQQQHLQQQHRLQQQQMRWMMMNQQRHHQRVLVRQPAVGGPVEGICLTVPPPHPPFTKGNSIGSALSDLERHYAAGGEHHSHAAMAQSAMAHSASFDQLITPSNFYGYNSEPGQFDGSDDANRRNELVQEHKNVQPYQHPHRRGVSAQLGQCHSLSADMNVAPVSYVNGSPAIRMRLGLKPHSSGFHKDSHRSINNRMFVRPTICSNANEQPTQSTPNGGGSGALDGVNNQDCAPVPDDQIMRNHNDPVQHHHQHNHASLGRVMSNPEYWVNQNSATVATISNANSEIRNDSTVCNKMAIANSYSNSCFKPGNLRNANSSQLLSPVMEPNHAFSSVTNQRSAPDLLASGLEMLSGNSQLRQLADCRSNWGSQLKQPVGAPFRQTEATFAAEAMEKALNEQLGLGGILGTVNPARQDDNPLFANNIYPSAGHMDQKPCQIVSDDGFVTSTGHLPYRHTPVTRYPSEPGSSDSPYRFAAPENPKFQSTDQLLVNCGDNNSSGIISVGLENRDLGSPATAGEHPNGVVSSAKLENLNPHSASQFAATSQQMPASANPGHQQHTIVYAMSSDPGGKVSPHQHDQSSQHLQANSKFGLSASGGNFYIPSTDIWGTVENSVQPFGFNQKHN